MQRMDVVQTMFAQSPNIANMVDPELAFKGQSLFVFTCWFSCMIHLINLFLKYGADVNHATDKGITGPMLVLISPHHTKDNVLGIFNSLRGRINLELVTNHDYNEGRYPAGSNIIDVLGKSQYYEALSGTEKNQILADILKI